MFGRNKIAMLVAEFLGTGFLTLVVLGVQRSTLGLPYFIGLAAGVALALSMYVFSATSGAHLNPAVTIALWTAQRIKTTAMVLYVAMQLLGGWAAYALYHYFANTTVQSIHAAFSTRVMIAEAVGALILGLAWAVAAYNKYETHRFVTIVGLAFAVGIIIASIPTGIGMINPAVALGSRAWAFWGANGWGTYALGPVVGAVVGVNLYRMLFAPVETLVAGVRATGSSSAKIKMAEKLKAADAEKVAPVEAKLASVEKTVKAKSSRSGDKKSATRKKR